MRTTAERRRAPRARSGSALAYEIVPATGISEDVALLLAYEKGAAADRRGRDALQHDRVPRAEPRRHVVDVPDAAESGRAADRRAGVSRLVSRQVGVWPLIAFTAAGLGAIAAAVLVSPDLRELIDLLGSRLLDLVGLR